MKLVQSGVYWKIENFPELSHQTTDTLPGIAYNITIEMQPKLMTLLHSSNIY